MRFRAPYAEDVLDWTKMIVSLPVVLPLLGIAWLDDVKRHAFGPDNNWRRWFAWFPVRMPDGHMAWLEVIERRGFGWLSYRDRLFSSDERLSGT